MDSIVDDLGNTRIPLATRQIAVDNLADGVMLCSEGAVSNLVDEARKLRLAGEGLLGHVRKIWETMVNQALRDFARENHREHPNYSGLEIHFVNGYRNAIARDFGLPPIHDAYIPTPDIQPYLQAVKGFVEQRAGANAVLTVLADEAFSEIDARYRPRYAEQSDSSRAIELSEQQVGELYADFEATLKYGLEMRFGPLDPAVLAHALPPDPSVVGFDADEEPPTRYRLIDGPEVLMDRIAHNLMNAGVFSQQQLALVNARYAPTSSTAFKQLTPGAILVEEKHASGDVIQRGVHAEDLAHLPIQVPVAPARIRAVLLAAKDEASLRRVPLERVWQLCSASASTNPGARPEELIKQLTRLEVRRYREANPAVDSALSNRVLDALHGQSAIIWQRALIHLLSNGGGAIANEVANRLAPRMGHLPDSLRWHDGAGRNVLHHAILSGAYGIAENMLEYYSHINDADKDGCTPLMMLAERGNVALVQWLLERNGRWDYKSNAGMTAMMYAAANGHVEALRALLEKDSEVNARLERKMRPLMLAAASGHVEVVEELLKHGADPHARNIDGKHALHFAAENGQSGVAELLATCMRPRDINAATVDGSTAVMLAADRSHVGVIALLGPKSDLRLTDKAGHTALMRAALGGKAESVQALLVAGADVNGVGSMKEHRTALILAVTRGHSEAMTTLMEGQADINRKGNAGRAALHEAVLHRQIGAVQWLLRNGADANLRDKEGYTPLVHAIDINAAEIVACLMQADPDTKSLERARRHATRTKRPELLALLNRP
ncbi:hypothetical protein PI87_24005 [Ralstonia sp. A12]|uniref:ankyrin repeat domain-containing protein n=1 Tax=Ralstonia sp. A12 TaxID=1217052 RepID=UPI00057596A9|nr:ankyrin repeat domain-containing protein [Ralstonia sp. A12]KHK49829.1 hypothetical protein PI87_24005 [Ralstonia sp. A12]